MALSTLTLNDLQRAWKRVKFDLENRVFIKSPFQRDLIESDLDAWLTPILEALQGGSVAVDPLYVAPVPKGRGLIRPGAWIPLHEHVAYTALLGLAYPKIYAAVGGSRGRLDLAYQLRKPGEVRWLRPRFECYDQFRRRSAAIAHKHPYVVFVDVAAYYENINLSYLDSQLRAMGVAPDAVDCLLRMLRAWEQTPGTGLPQGLSPSDILAKVYLDAVDRQFEASGATFVRYVDDVRIAAESEPAAKRLLVRYIELLRERGLQVQSRKTMICPQEVALAEINRAAPVIARINKHYTEEVIKALPLEDGDPYMPVFELDALVEAHPGEISDAPITAELHNLLATEGTEANPSILRYLYNRLAKSSSRYGWQDLLNLLGPRPEETAFILSHLASVGVVAEAEPLLVQFLDSDRAVYDYQNSQIVYWMAKNIEAPSEAAILVARRLEQGNNPWYLKVAARWLLARGGQQVDLDQMEEQHRLAPNLHREDIDLLFCLKGQERSRRNRLLGRAKDRHPMYARVEKALKNV
ncbi:MAG: reverse transcriptase domain-containing protein [Thermoleophilia bacterium]